MGPDTAIQLKHKVENREWIFMVGDRLSVQENSRQLKVHLLGEEAPLSEGPFVLAYLLEVPVYAIHCYKQGRRFRIQLRHLNPVSQRSAKTKMLWLKEMADQYAQELETVILQDPLQWYNFYSFWGTT